MRHDLIGMVRCLSLTDTFWMKRADEDLAWERVSLYRNPFDDAVARIAFDGTGMYGRANSPTSPEFATSGSFAKCWIRESGGIYLLKRGSEGFVNAGCEPYSGKLASDLLAAAGVDHVPYSLVRFHKRLTCKCPLFTSKERGLSRRIGSWTARSVRARCSSSLRRTARRRASARWSSWTP